MTTSYIEIIHKLIDQDARPTSCMSSVFCFGRYLDGYGHLYLLARSRAAVETQAEGFIKGVYRGTSSASAELYVGSNVRQAVEGRGIPPSTGRRQGCLFNYEQDASSHAAILLRLHLCCIPTST